MADISTNIKRLREAAGLSQEQLAHMIGKTRSAISQYENGTSLPRMGVVEDLAHVFGVSKAQLIDSRITYHYMNIASDGSSTWANEGETELLEAFRKLTPEKQEQLIRIAKTL